MKALKEIKKDLNSLYKQNKHLYISSCNDIENIAGKISAYYENSNDFSFQLLFERIKLIEYDLSKLSEYINSIMVGIVSGIIVSIFDDASGNIENVAAVILSMFFMITALKLQSYVQETNFSQKKLFLDLEHTVLVKILEEQYGYKYK